MVIIMYLLSCFIFYSIFGYFFETILGIITKSYYKSGFLHGFWTPIYGIGAVIIILLSNYFFKNLHLPRWKETVIVFFIMAIFLMCIEAIGGILIEKTFHVVFWDYTKYKFHIGHYISLEVALMWGVMSVIFIYLINPLCSGIIKKVPSFVTISLSICMVLDFLYTIINGTIKK